MHQFTPSRNVGSRPRAKKCRSTQSRKTVTPASAAQREYRAAAGHQTK